MGKCIWLANKMDQFRVFLLAEDEGINLNFVLNAAEDLAQPIDVEDLEERGNVIRNENYFEEVVPRYPDSQFKDHFRMSRATFQDLVQVIGVRMGRERGIIPLPKKVMYTVWMLSKPESFLAAGDRFGIAPSSGHYIFKEIVNVLASLIPEYIKWPDVANYGGISNVFQDRSHGIPGVIGAVDGCHIPIKQPPGNANDFYNRKGVHSIILQGVCDHNAKFIDVFIGMPGRLHDARVFRNSPLFGRLRDEANPLLPPEYHIIGDSAYPLMPYLMTPFRDTGHLTNEQTHYNVRLSSIRSIIERAFGFLKGKFRRLKYLDMADLELANHTIAAACVLHNFIIEHHDVAELGDIHDEGGNEENAALLNGEDAGAAVEKRNNIVLLLN